MGRAVCSKARVVGVAFWRPDRRSAQRDRATPGSRVRLPHLVISGAASARDQRESNNPSPQETGAATPDSPAAPSRFGPRSEPDRASFRPFARNRR
jgi:hypothetical protein